MAQVKVYYDQLGNTLTVWFGNPEDEVEVEETGDEVILIKDQRGSVIGFEKLNFAATQSEALHLAFENLPPEPATDYLQAYQRGRTRQLALRENALDTEQDE